MTSAHSDATPLAADLAPPFDRASHPLDAGSPSTRPTPGDASASASPEPTKGARPRRRARSRAQEPVAEVTVFDLFVILAAATVSLAAGTALTLHGGLDMVPAAVLAILLYAGLVLGHIFLARFQARAATRRPRVAAPSLSDRTSRLSTSVVGAPEQGERVGVAELNADVQRSAIQPLASAGPSEADADASFERLQSLVAKMAADVKLAEASDRPLAGERAQGQGRSILPASGDGVSAGTPGMGSAVAFDAQMDTAVAALNTFLSDMKPAPARLDALGSGAEAVERAGLDGQSSAANNNAQAIAPAAKVVDEALLAGPFGQSVAGAIANHRVRMYIEPIQGLTDAKARHLDVTMRLIDAEGYDLDLGATRAFARQTGLSPVLDALKLPRAARIARNFAVSGDAAVLTTLDGETLADREFRDGAALSLAGTEGARILLTFSQADVRAFGPVHWQTLLELVRHGVRFSIDGITDLDMDFEGLRALGFEFVKLDAATYLEGLPGEHGVVPATDVVRHFKSAGLEPIIEGITEVAQLIHVQGTGALLGTGQLFGGPKPVRSEIVAPEARAA